MFSYLLITALVHVTASHCLSFLVSGKHLLVGGLGVNVVSGYFMFLVELVWKVSIWFIVQSDICDLPGEDSSSCFTNSLGRTSCN